MDVEVGTGTVGAPLFSPWSYVLLFCGFVGYIVVVGRIGRGIDVRRGGDRAFRDGWLAGAVATPIVAVVVGSVCATVGWPWWAVGAAVVVAGPGAGVLIGAVVFARARPVSRPIGPGRAGTDAAERSTLRAALIEQSSREGLLLAWARVHPLLPDFAEHRYGRAVAAELADLVRQGAVRIDRTGADAPWSVAVQLPAQGPQARHPEQRRLLDALGRPGDRVVVAATRSATTDQRWDPLAQWLSAERRRRTRPAAVRGLRRLRRQMRRHVRGGARRFEHDPDLYRLGLPFAILGGRYDRVPEWPWPPTSDPAWVPHALVQACVIATTYPGQERPENLP